jgi:hypothetical protein
VNMINFSAPVTPVVVVEQPAPVTRQEVAVRPAPVARATHKLVAPADWSWEQLRDYVLAEIQRVHGLQPRIDEHKEAAIFQSYLKRYGADAVRIAKYAFEVAGGYWKGGPISVYRFCRASDDFFGAVILQRLAD